MRKVVKQSLSVKMRIGYSLDMTGHAGFRLHAGGMRGGLHRAPCPHRRRRHVAQGKVGIYRQRSRTQL
ncbi:MAG: hypothetical protein MZU95_09755 [Desulfomicrobium escambiense]|nr:hypothetical protein [Desulfomicrobium escambiense]